VINELSTTGAKRENDYITTFNKKYDATQENNLVAVLENMMVDKDKRVRDFASDLFDFTLLQSGFNGSPISYVKLLPNSILVQRMEDSITTFFSKPYYKDLLKSFSDQFIRNNYLDKNIVPRYRDTFYPQGRQFIDISDKRNYMIARDTVSLNAMSSGVGSRFITVRVLLEEGKAAKKNKQMNIRNKYDIYLYELDNPLVYEERDKKKQYPKSVYKKIGRLGDGFRMLEYYTTFEDVNSILSKNNITNNVQTQDSTSIQKLI